MSERTTTLGDLLDHIAREHRTLSNSLSAVHYDRNTPIPLTPQTVDGLIRETGGGTRMVRPAVNRLIVGTIIGAIDIAEAHSPIEGPSTLALHDFDEDGHRADCSRLVCACLSDLMGVVRLMDKRLNYLPKHLKELVRDLTLMPGWSARLATSYESDGAGGLHLWITSDTEDSMKPGERIRVGHPFLVPHASWNRDVWAAWLLDRFHDVLRHEGCEFFRIGGYREFAPHHSNGEDPYRVWHVSDHDMARRAAGDD